MIPRRRISPGDQPDLRKGKGKRATSCCWNAIARDPQAFILKQGWACGLAMVARPRRRPHDKAGRKLDAKERRAVGDWTFFRFPLASAPGGSAPPGEDESVIERITAAQREELETEITGLQTEAEQAAEEAVELAGEVPF